MLKQWPLKYIVKRKGGPGTEHEMAQDDMNTKWKDMFEETAEVEKNVSDGQEQEIVYSNSSKKVKGNIVITNYLI